MHIKRIDCVCLHAALVLVKRCCFYKLSCASTALCHFLPLCKVSLYMGTDLRGEKCIRVSRRSASERGGIGVRLWCQLFAPWVMSPCRNPFICDAKSSQRSVHVLQLVGGAGKQESEKNKQRMKVILIQNEIKFTSCACST